MKNARHRPNFTALRWELFVTAEVFRQIEDTAYLQRVQKSVVDNELDHITAATEALESSAATSANLGKGRDEI